MAHAGVVDAFCENYAMKQGMAWVGCGPETGRSEYPRNPDARNSRVRSICSLIYSNPR
jgi:hypothetical protein